MEQNCYRVKTTLKLDGLDIDLPFIEISNSWHFYNSRIHGEFCSKIKMRTCKIHEVDLCFERSLNETFFACSVFFMINCFAIDFYSKKNFQLEMEKRQKIEIYMFQKNNSQTFRSQYLGFFHFQLEVFINIQLQSISTYSFMEHFLKTALPALFYHWNFKRRFYTLVYTAPT